MRTKRRLAWISGITLASGVAGVLSTHILDYYILYRNPVIRAFVLARTGHPYLRHIPGAIGVGLVVALVGMWRLGWRDGRAPAEHRQVPTFSRLFGTVASAQVAGFVGLEVFERINAGLPLSTIFGRALAVGLVIQVAIACAAALALYFVRRLARTVARARSTRVGARAAARILVVFEERVLAARLTLGSVAPRAPPAASHI